MRRKPDRSPLKSGAERPAHQRAPEAPADRPELLDAGGRFHRHLDGCAQCRNQPFALCMTGALLLTAVRDGR